MENKKAIEVNNLQKSFKGKRVFNDLSMSINEGDITTIFGPSGSGKSTILNIIGLLESYNAGMWHFLGKKCLR